ncbi:phage-related putative exported protein [Thioalkalivibrio sulfidiphilus HL-EbGr7]|uniref:Phage-related putative exported protein n=1 Tax=Thioalkalivibrio sulfidiphilus (strain HL-EbGR7) TaxID=396588 RepID=B8GUY7_THISH|nr:capsid cement protein [Thioalkalivibrio sulfidiphilus]ACL71498.1 phage-related putative exported protein [Thioalkalivibrio sulfidiphilus HL-EbGr7]
MPSQNIAILTLSIAAAAALSPHRFVTAAGAVASAGGNALGVTRSEADTGDMTPVDVLGTTRVTAGAAITAGAAVQVGSDGKAITLAAGEKVGRALEAAGADGDLIEIVLIPN